VKLRPVSTWNLRPGLLERPGRPAAARCWQNAHINPALLAAQSGLNALAADHRSRPAVGEVRWPQKHVAWISLCWPRALRIHQKRWPGRSVRPGLLLRRGRWEHWGVLLASPQRSAWTKTARIVFIRHPMYLGELISPGCGVIGRPSMECRTDHVLLLSCCCHTLGGAAFSTMVLTRRVRLASNSSHG
jgi:hypothetical protein